MTAGSWAKWVAPIATLGALKRLIGLVSGTTLSPPLMPVARVIPGETLLFFMAVGILTIRFSLNSPRLSEKIALVVVVFATCFDMLFEPQPVILAVGVGVLLLSRTAGALTQKWWNHNAVGWTIKNR